MDDVSGEENGSARLGYAGAKASKIPRRFAVGVNLRREGRSDGLMIVGFALSLPSASIVDVSGAACTA